MLAYVGLGPGQELIPYFLALVGFAGAALLAVLQWPLRILLGWYARIRRTPPAPVTSQPVETSASEGAGEGRHEPT
jgi:hypothetical protein